MDVSGAALAVGVGAGAARLSVAGGSPDLESGVSAAIEKEESTKYCCCLTEAQIKQVGRVSGAALIVFGIINLGLGWFSGSPLHGASGAVCLIGGVVVIYFTENFQGLGAIVRALKQQRTALTAERQRLEALSIEKERQAQDLQAQIEALSKADDDLRSTVEDGVDDAEKASALLQATAARTGAAVTTSITTGMAKFGAGVTTELTRFHEGSRPFVAMARELQTLRAEIAALKAEIVRLKGTTGAGDEKDE